MVIEAKGGGEGGEVVEEDEDEAVAGGAPGEEEDVFWTAATRVGVKTGEGTMPGGRGMEGSAPWVMRREAMSV